MIAWHNTFLLALVKGDEVMLMSGSPLKYANYYKQSHQSVCAVYSHL